MGEDKGGNDDSGASVVIGMDPHKRTVTIEVMSASEQVVGHGRFTTDEAGFAAMLDYARRWSMCRRSCQRACGCMPPGRAARPMTLTRTRSR